jgi:hypothetical protein
MNTEEKPGYKTSEAIGSLAVATSLLSWLTMEPNPYVRALIVAGIVLVATVYVNGRVRVKEANKSANNLEVPI